MLRWQQPQNVTPPLPPISHVLCATLASDPDVASMIWRRWLADRANASSLQHLTIKSHTCTSGIEPCETSCKQYESIVIALEFVSGFLKDTQAAVCLQLEGNALGRRLLSYTSLLHGLAGLVTSVRYNAQTLEFQHEHYREHEGLDLYAPIEREDAFMLAMQQLCHLTNLQTLLLEYLDAYHSDADLFIPHDISRLAHLRSISAMWCEKNEITQWGVCEIRFPTNVSNLTALTALRLVDLQVPAMDLSLLCHLRKLTLDGAYSIGASLCLPDSLTNLSQLEVLRMKGSGIEGNVWALQDLGSLRDLRWSTEYEGYAGLLSRLPSELWPVICSLTGLESLVLQNDSDAFVWESVQDVLQLSKLHHLTRLRLENFEIRHCHVPHQLQALRSLQLQHLYMESLSVPRELDQITYLNLDSNHLERMPDDVSRMTNLTELSISWQELSYEQTFDKGFMLTHAMPHLKEFECIQFQSRE